MLVAIHAYDQLYGAYHGIESHDIMEVSSEQEAYNEAEVLSREVIDSFINLEELVDDPDDYDDDEYEDAINEDIAYDVQIIIDPEIIALYQKSSSIVEEMFWQDHEEFFSKYCKEFDY